MPADAALTDASGSPGPGGQRPGRGVPHRGPASL